MIAGESRRDRRGARGGARGRLRAGRRTPRFHADRVAEALSCSPYCAAATTLRLRRRGSASSLKSAVECRRCAPLGRLVRGLAGLTPAMFLGARAHDVGAHFAGVTPSSCCADEGVDPTSPGPKAMQALTSAPPPAIREFERLSRRSRCGSLNEPTASFAPLLERRARFSNLVSELSWKYGLGGGVRPR